MAKRRITKLIINKLFGTISEKSIAIFGFAFKANTNDTRESPAISIALELLNEGAFLRIYDPKVNYLQIENDLAENNKKEKHQFKKKKLAIFRRYIQLRNGYRRHSNIY